MSKLEKIAFRVDSSIKIGAGHLMRCLNIAKFLRLQGHDCIFISKKHNGNYNHLIEGNDFALIEIDAGDINQINHIDDLYMSWLGSSYSEDAEYTNEILANNSCQYLFVDHYGIDERWEECCRTQTLKIIAIDDLANRNHSVDYIIDHNAGRLNADYANINLNDAQLLIGPKYALLHSRYGELRNQAIGKRNSNEIKDILISFGSSNQTPIIKNILESFHNAKINSNFHLTLALGSSINNHEDIYLLAKKITTKIDLHINTNQMPDLILQADFCVGAGGVNALERCCLGLPSAILCLSENQVPGSIALEKMGCCNILNSYPSMDYSFTDIIDSINNKNDLIKMTNQCFNIVDGKGIERVYKKIFKS